jgi:hypothetical protein
LVSIVAASLAVVVVATTLVAVVAATTTTVVVASSSTAHVVIATSVVEATTASTTSATSSETTAFVGAAYGFGLTGTKRGLRHRDTVEKHRSVGILRVQTRHLVVYSVHLLVDINHVCLVY